MKKMFIGLFLIILLLLTGCTTPVETEPALEPEPAVETEGLQGLDVDNAIDLVVSAQKAFFHISSGGNDFVYEGFEYEGYPYRYILHSRIIVTRVA